MQQVEQVLEARRGASRHQRDTGGGEAMGDMEEREENKAVGLHAGCSPSAIGATQRTLAMNHRPWTTPGRAREPRLQQALSSSSPALPKAACSRPSMPWMLVPRSCPGTAQCSAMARGMHNLHQVQLSSTSAAQFRFWRGDEPLSITSCQLRIL